MRDFNPFTQWKHLLLVEHTADIRRWYGCDPYNQSQDAEIGMYISGISVDYAFRAIEQRVSPLRRGFVPQVSPLSAAIHPELEPHKNVIAAFSRAVAPDVDRFIEQVLCVRTTSTQPVVHIAPTKEEILEQLTETQRVIQQFNEERRRRALTNFQIVQLCAYFDLRSLDAIIQFIEEHKR